jgi:hypothetical protein
VKCEARSTKHQAMMVKPNKSTMGEEKKEKKKGGEEEKKKI